MTTKKRTLKKKILYVLLGLTILSVLGFVGGVLYLKHQFFRDHPNAITFEGELHSVPFEWSEQKYDSYTEPYNAILIPVSVPGLPNTFYMQFDTGSPYTYLRSGCLESIKSRGIEFELFENDEKTLIKKFELNVGGNRVILNSGRVLARDIRVDWDDPDAINVIGTIGSDFIDQKICAIDFPAREIRLYESRPDGLNSLGRFTPFKFKGRRILLPAVIDGSRLELLYDSGCSPFGLLTSKYHFNRYTDPEAKEINIDANRRGESIPVHHKPCELMMQLGGTELPLTRVSYVEMYEALQETVGRFSNLGGLSGFLGNQGLTKSTLVLDTKANEFLVVNHSLHETDRNARIERNVESQGNSESRTSEARHENPQVIPFTLTESNNISIDVVLNGKHTLALMFHTGNSDVCLTKAATEKLADLVFDQEGDANSWGGASSTRFCQGNALKIGDHVWDDITVFEDRLSGQGTDGKFGPDLFQGKVIEIDFDRRILVVHDSLPEIASAFQQFDCRQHRNSIFIQGQLQIGGKTLANEFMVHSGFGGTILLDDQFVSLNNLDQLETISESELRDSFGNVLKTKKVLLPKLSFGDSSFSNIPIGFFAGAIGKQKMSVVGGDVLKRFNIILGADRTQLYLKPNRLFDLEFGK